MAVSAGDVWTNCQCRSSVHGADADANMAFLPLTILVLFFGVYPMAGDVMDLSIQSILDDLTESGVAQLSGALGALLICILGNSDGF